MLVFSVMIFLIVFLCFSFYSCVKTTIVFRCYEGCQNYLLGHLLYINATCFGFLFYIHLFFSLTSFLFCFWNVKFCFTVLLWQQQKMHRFGQQWYYLFHDESVIPIFVWSVMTLSIDGLVVFLAPSCGLIWLLHWVTRGVDERHGIYIKTLTITSSFISLHLLTSCFIHSSQVFLFVYNTSICLDCPWLGSSSTWTFESVVVHIVL